MSIYFEEFTVILQIFGALKFRYRAIAERSVSFNPLSMGQSKIGRRRPISLDNHCVNISQRIFINKISLERSFHYLNADTLFLENWTRNDAATAV